MSILLTKCAACSTEVSVKAPACPKCGHPNLQTGGVMDSQALQTLAGKVHLGRMGILAAVIFGGILAVKYVSSGPDRGRRHPQPRYDSGAPQDDLGDDGEMAQQQVPQQRMPQRQARQQQMPQRQMQQQPMEQQQPPARPQRTASKFGPRPEQGGRNGAYREVASYLKQAAQDPSSLEIERCSEPNYDERLGWVVGCEFRTSNSRGEMTPYANWFIIRDQKVVKLLGKDEYKSSRMPSSSQNSRPRPGARASRPMAAQQRYAKGGDDCSPICGKMDQCGFWSYSGCMEYCNSHPEGNEVNNSRAKMSCQMLGSVTGFSGGGRGYSNAGSGSGSGDWVCRAVGSYVHGGSDGAPDYGSPQVVDVTGSGRTRDIAGSKAIDACSGIMHLSVNQTIKPGSLETDFCKVLSCSR